MIVYKLDPLEDPRWPELLRHHPQATIFHTPGWLNALRGTYGYEPMVLTTSAPNAELRNGLVFCQINSWLTGRRLVSLPFSDHCQPLADGADLEAVLEYLRNRARSERWKYIELRLLSGDGSVESRAPFIKGTGYGFHKIDLRPDADTIFRGFHDSCIRRKIRKAERERLTYEAGQSDSLLRKFHHLLVLTRRRHMLPPQPLAWFQNLIARLKEQLTIHVVSKDGEPAASIMTLSYKTSLVYKYGCSDSKFNNLGGTPLLFWKAIQEGKQAGAEEFDLGRSDLEDPGLSTFKGHLGGAASELNYYRYCISQSRKSPATSKRSYLREAFARMPDPIFTGAGRLLYRHMG
jgi:CelD/BcsL family acetyltransferase involved in cellulose biosynthesis